VSSKEVRISWHKFNTVLASLRARPTNPLTQRVCVPAPSLHGRYPLPRYYGPVRLPNRAATWVMSSPRTLAFATPPGLPEPALSNAKGSSTDLSPRAVPFHPGKSRGCSRSLLHHGRQASSTSGDWPLSLRANGPIGFTCVTARGFAFQGFGGGITPTSAWSAICRMSNYRVSSFQLTRSARLVLAHRDSTWLRANYH
jgi:hypothetical protein